MARYTVTYIKSLSDEDADLYVWQVLLQLVNHAPDHRAQLLRCVHDAGIKTVSQDYIFYAYDVPWLLRDGTS